MSEQNDNSINEMRKRMGLKPIREMKSYEDYLEESKQQKDLSNYVGSKQFKGRFDKK